MLFRVKEKRIFLTDIRGVNKYYYFMSKRRVHFTAFYLSSCIPREVSTSRESEMHSSERDSINMDAKNLSHNANINTTIMILIIH